MVCAIIIGQDLAAYPGVAGTAEQLEPFAAEASAVVVEAWADPVDPVPAWVKRIALNAAARATWNPKGLAMLSRAVDDAKRTEQYGEGSVGQAGIWLTADELARLGGLGSSPGVGSIRTVPRGWCQG